MMYLPKRWAVNVSAVFGFIRACACGRSGAGFSEFELLIGLSNGLTGVSRGRFIISATLSECDGLMHSSFSMPNDVGSREKSNLSNVARTAEDEATAAEDSDDALN